MLAVAALLAASAILAGCAVPGEPTVRHPLTPEPVTDLVARQQGDAVVLSFTLPTKSTEQKPLTMLPTVDVYRTARMPLLRTAAPGAAPPKLTPHLSETIPSDAIEDLREKRPRRIVRPARGG